MSTNAEIPQSSLVSAHATEAGLDYLNPSLGLEDSHSTRALLQFTYIEAPSLAPLSRQYLAPAFVRLSTLNVASVFLSHSQTRPRILLFEIKECSADKIRRPSARYRTHAPHILCSIEI